MLHGICHIASIPVRIKPDDTSEMLTQVLFGETLSILETYKQWRKVRLSFDDYVGWVDEKQFKLLSEESFNEHTNKYAVNHLLWMESSSDFRKVFLPLGASLPFAKNMSFKLDNELFNLFEEVDTAGQSFKKLKKIAFSLMESPYLWGGRTPLGIDCSGFTQLIYKTIGIPLKRDAKDQESEGIPVDLLSKSKEGDLAFFINKEKKIHHTGLILEDNTIMHACGKIRIDKLDDDGIYNKDKKSYTHKLHSIKRILI